MSLILWARMVHREIESPISWPERLTGELFLTKQQKMNGAIKTRFPLPRFVFLSPGSVIPLVMNKQAWTAAVGNPLLSLSVLWA